MSHVRPGRTRVRWFVDTSGFFASSNIRDPNHDSAQRVLARAAADGVGLVTTVYIVAETQALFLAKVGRDAGIRFLRRMEGGSVDIVRPTEGDEARAREIIYGYTDKDFSLTDAISFSVMERLGVAKAFTFDSDFRQYGFAVAEG